MKVHINYTVDVTRCAHCPHCKNTMDGPECEILMRGVYPEGRLGIHPDCPIKNK